MSLELLPAMPSPLPVIEISFAPPEEPQPEPYSPFSPLSASFAPALGDDSDTYRPALLSPPVPGFTLSPLRPLTTPKHVNPKGMGSEQFQMLLRTSKERSAAPAIASGPKRQDLRKEVALKAHKSKQMERRALFLSKIGAPPSPSAVGLPKTPPDSPAVFHYSLPSPGLVSPLALFESLELDSPHTTEPKKVWVEQVDFRLQRRTEPEPVSFAEVDLREECGQTAQYTGAQTPVIKLSPAPPQGQRRRNHARQGSIPSLEQITERFIPQAAGQPTRTPIPLPAFLSARRQSPPPEESPRPTPPQTEATPTARPRLQLPIGSGRLRLPLRAVPPPPVGQPPAKPKTLPALPPLPGLAPPRPPTLQITTTRVPDMRRAPAHRSPVQVQLTEANLRALDSRARMAHDMLCVVRRRTAVCFPAPARATSRASGSGEEDEERARRRNSAPAELPQTLRREFAHPVLALPGGF